MKPDISHFKHCMAKFATGITVVTTLAENNKKIGVTINSFNSVSLNPFLVLFSLNKFSHFYSYFDQNQHCTINILAEDQKYLSQLFTKLVDDNWQQVKTAEGTFTSSPAIADTMAFLECEIYRKYEGGDHTIFVCKVVNLVEQKGKNPLIYFGSEYRALASNKKLD
jgi:flavin reductase (DIM6/NTAB) family NADH-FMN oxidoreductase RutF